ncbi:MAG: MmcQ/YjbR family DNA-binding protein [Muribaculaceae bacterium]|nr:MmcQ/YjbR family DNA-binding protein [Muribaculaceae bacterium]
MNVEQLRDFCLSLGEVTEKLPFGKFSSRYDSLLVFYVKEHMFCMFDLDDFTWVAMRSTADVIEEISLTHNDVLPGRKNMRLWLNAGLGGDITDTMIFNLIRRAYEIINDRYSSKKKNSEAHSGSKKRT